VIEAAHAAGLASLRLEIANPGLSLELQWGGAGPTAPAAAVPPGDDPEDRTPRETIVTAPVLGVLYRRATPDQPVLVEEGGHVTAGQTLALLEVMKTYHEVQAPHAGILVAFLVDDGRFVEYGQAIARLALAENDDAAT
jgi:acetyl-CoA carboxylase biotin carboxyl carrier protein